MNKKTFSPLEEEAMMRKFLAQWHIPEASQDFEQRLVNVCEQRIKTLPDWKRAMMPLVACLVLFFSGVASVEIFPVNPQNESIQEVEMLFEMVEMALWEN